MPRSAKWEASPHHTTQWTTQHQSTSPKVTQCCHWAIAATKWKKPYDRLAKAVSLSGDTQQDTTMSLMFEYFTPTCPVTIPTHLCTKCRQHHRRRNTVHPLCPWCEVWCYHTSLFYSTQKICDMKQQCSTGVWHGGPSTQATQVMLHHHEWAEMPSFICRSWPAIMCIHGSPPSAFSYKYMKWTLALEELQGCIPSEKLTFI